MKMVTRSPYMYYIDPACVLTAGNYEKLLRRGVYLQDVRRIAIKLGIYEGETKKEFILAKIFDFLQNSGIAEPIRVKISKKSQQKRSIKSQLNLQQFPKKFI